MPWRQTSSTLPIRGSLLAWLVISVVFASGCGSNKSKQAAMLRDALRKKELQRQLGETGDNEDDEDEKPAPPPAQKKPQPAAEPPQAEEAPAAKPTVPTKPVEVASSASSSDGPASSAAVPEKASFGTPVKPPEKPLTEYEKTQRTIQNMEKIAAAIAKFSEARQGFPAQAISDSSGTNLLSWRVTLLPYLGYGELYKQFDLTKPWYAPQNKALLEFIPPVYQSPERFDTETNYLAVVSGTSLIRSRGSSPDGRGIALRQVEDGADTCIAIVEANASVPWTKPADFAFALDNPMQGLGGIRQGGFLGGFGDGMVGWIKKLGRNAARAMVSADGGERFTAASVMEPVDTLLAMAKAAEQPVVAVAPASTNGASDPTTSGPASPPTTAGSPTPAVAVSSAKVTELRERAKELFAAGEESDAFNLYYMSILASNQNDRWYEEMKWYNIYPRLSRPAITMRWAVCIDSDLPTDQAPDPLNPDRNIQDPVFQTENVTAIRETTGELSLRLLKMLHDFEVGGCEQFPLSLSTVAAAGRAALTVEHEDPLHDNRHEPRYLIPGVSYLAPMNRTGALFQARKHSIDILAEFKIARKTNFPTTFVLIDVRSGKEIFETKPITAKQVLNQRENAEDDEDTAVEEFAKVRNYIEANLTPTDMPPLKPEHARARVDSLLTREYKNPLPILVEIRYFLDRGLISQVGCRMAYQRILGDEKGEVLADGTPDERVEVLSPWRPKPKRIMQSQRRGRRDDDD